MKTLKKIRVFLANLSLLLVATTITLYGVNALAGFIIENWYADRFNLPNNPITNYVDFSHKYLFWRPSNCKSYPDSCHLELADTITHTPLVYEKGNRITDSSGCTRLLFLGDSFTEGPWMTEDATYVGHFTRKYSVVSNKCAVGFRLGAGGTGNSQQLARFSDAVEEIQPDVVFWQFFSNDMTDNVRMSVHTTKQGKLARTSAIFNSFFIIGYLYENIPGIRGTSLGKLVLNSMMWNDPFNSWPVDANDIDAVNAYNRKMMPLMLAEMDDLSVQYDFDWYTTLAPLECLFDKLSDCDYFADYQNVLTEIVSSQTNFLAISPESFWIHDIAEEKLFHSAEEQTGYRHLSQVGNEYFGLHLLLQFLDRQRFNVSKILENEKQFDEVSPVVMQSLKTSYQSMVGDELRTDQ